MAQAADCPRLPHEGMKKSVLAFYAGKYPDVAAARAADIDKLVTGLDDIYDRNVFPEMNVSWKSYPSNIGHRTTSATSPAAVRRPRATSATATEERATGLPLTRQA